MENVKAIISKLNEFGISVYEYKEDKKLCGYELNTYTDGGVNQNVFLDFRNSTFNPKNAEDFLTVYNSRVESIDIDEELEINRQNAVYKRDFTLTEGLQDFKQWKDNLQSIFN